MNAGSMLIFHNHPHELEYYRLGARGDREHVYTELAHDQGFVLEHHPERRESWLARYATACAHDYLERVRAKPGRWQVHVYRLWETERTHIVSIRTNWPPAC